MEAFVESEIKNGIATITFFHPQSNSLPGTILRKLADEITAAGNNPLVMVIVLKSEGEKAFCAGASFDELIAIKNLEEGKKFFSGFSFVINAIRKAPQFVIARVHGKAVGGGVGKGHRHVRVATRTPVGCLLSSVANRFGVPMERFGDGVGMVDGIF